MNALPMTRALLGLALFTALSCGDNNTGGTPDNPPLPMPGPGEAGLAVGRTGAGTGTVISSPQGINCGDFCAAVFKADTAVQLTAVPDAGSFFAGWSGACGGTGTCDLRLTGTQAVNARFEPIPPKARLTIRRAGVGGGRMYSEPAGVDCGTNCTAEFQGGTHVRIHLLSDPGNRLLGWTAGPCQGAGRCEFDLNQDTTIEATFTPRLCTSPSFCWDNPSPQGDSLFGMIGFAKNDVWALGARGVVMRWNGSGWLATSSGVDDKFLNVWGTSSSNLYAVGENGPIYRWDGTRWSVAYSLIADLSVPALYGFASNDIWAAGRRGRFYHFTGAGWTQLNSPTNETLWNMWGPAANDIWAVGSAGTILHWNGSNWQTSNSGTSTFLRSVWGSSPSSVWAVGDGGLVLRWNGASWQPVSIGATEALTRVLGTSASDVWITSVSGKVYHFDGTAWAAQTVTAAPINALWPVADSEVWVGGDAGALAHLEGGRWTSLTAGPNRDLFAIWGAAEDDIFAVGQGAAAHYDGYQWSNLAIETNAALKAVWGSSGSDVWIVGERGTVLRYNGKSLTPVPGAPQGADLKGVAGSGPNDVWIVGSTGMLHWDGAALAPFDPMLAVPLSHVRSVGPGEIYAAEGLLVHVKGGVRLPLVNVTRPVVGLWGSGPSDLWLGYDDGTFQRYDGSKLGMLQPVVLLSASRFWASGPSDVWALGSGGRHARWDGNSSTQFNNGFSTSFNAVWGSGPANTWFVGQNGQIARFKP